MLMKWHLHRDVKDRDSPATRGWKEASLREGESEQVSLDEKALQRVLSFFFFQKVREDLDFQVMSW